MNTTHPLDDGSRHNEWCVTEGGNTGPSSAYAQNVLCHIKHQCRHTVLQSGLDKPLHWLTGKGKGVEQGSGAERVWSLFFSQATHCWTVWTTGQLGLKLSTATWIAPRFPHCFPIWTRKTYRNTIYTWRMAAEDNCCFCSPPTSNTGHTNVLKRMNLQQGAGKISLKFSGKLIMKITVPSFSSKAIRASFPHLPHLYWKVTEITNICVWLWETQVRAKEKKPHNYKLRSPAVSFLMR